MKEEGKEREKEEKREGGGGREGVMEEKKEVGGEREWGGRENGPQLQNTLQLICPGPQQPEGKKSAERGKSNKT